MPTIIRVPHGEAKRLVIIPAIHKAPGKNGIIGISEVVDLEALTAITKPSQKTTTTRPSKVFGFISMFGQGHSCSLSSGLT